MQRTVLGVFIVSGFVAIALEVVWFRVLVLYLESNTYAFTIMLATVLGGIALGSFVAAPLLARRVDHVRVLVVTEFGVAIAAASSLLFLSKSYARPQPCRRPRDVRRRRSRVRRGRERVGDPADHVPDGSRVPDRGPRVRRRRSRHRPARSARSMASTSQPASPGRSLPGSCSYRCSGRVAALIVLVLASVSAALVLAFTAWEARRDRTIIAMVTVALVALVLGPLVPNPFTAALRYRYPDERLLWIEEGAQTTASIQERSDGTRVDVPRRIAPGERRRVHGRLPPLDRHARRRAPSRPARGTRRRPGRWRDGAWRELDPDRARRGRRAVRGGRRAAPTTSNAPTMASSTDRTSTSRSTTAATTFSSPTSATTSSLPT